ncbi:hypothetical protein O5559_27290, partial [Escherichia coli]|nr:hypothetical protein [Escherichia coli]
IRWQCHCLPPGHGRARHKTIVSTKTVYYRMRWRSDLHAAKGTPHWREVHDEQQQPVCHPTGGLFFTSF